MIKAAVIQFAGSAAVTLGAISTGVGLADVSNSYKGPVPEPSTPHYMARENMRRDGGLAIGLGLAAAGAGAAGFATQRRKYSAQER